MKTESIRVNYRDKSTTPPTTVSLGVIDAPRFESVEEAVEYFDKEESGKGVELVLEYVHVAYDIELQRRKRDAERPDKPKTVSNLSKFKQLSADKQEELLKAAGLLQ